MKVDKLGIKGEAEMHVSVLFVCASLIGEKYTIACNLNILKYFF